MSSATRLAPPSVRLRLVRIAFNLTWLAFCRWTPRFLHGPRRFVLRLFGAVVHHTAHIYPDCRIWLPANLTLEEKSCLGPRVECYCVAPVRLGRNAVVSQDAYLCAAGHDVHASDFPLVGAPIALESESWVGARAVILPGVTVGHGAVIAAASVVTKDVAPNAIVAGNPARQVGTRAKC